MQNNSNKYIFTDLKLCSLEDFLKTEIGKIKTIPMSFKRVTKTIR